MIKERPQIISIQPITQEPSAWPFADISEDQWTSGSPEELRQRILVLLEPAKRGYEVEQENQLLREKIGTVESILDVDLDELVESQTVEQWDRDTVLTPYAPERIDAKLTDLKSKYRHAHDLLVEEIEEIARSAWKMLDSHYRQDQDRRQREEIRTNIQQITELIPAEKDVVIGLVEESLSRYPSLDAEMTIPVGQFNRKHVGLRDDNTVTKKFRALEQIGVLLDYQPGEIDKSNPERPFTTPARIRLNTEMILAPAKIKKPDDLKPGGNRQNPVCKNTECLASDPHKADEIPHTIDRFAVEYCDLCDTSTFLAVPGTRSEACIHNVIRTVQKGKFIITGQLHQFAQNAVQEAMKTQKHDAFQEIQAPASIHIFVDDVQTYDTQLPYKQWCHMATNGPIEELHAMADALRLKREWFQDKKGHPHYDLTPTKRKQAIALGAIPVSAQELIHACYPRLASVMGSQKHDAFEQLYEIGYRALKALETIDQAIAQNPTLMVIDIRHTPSSRNPSWTKAAFEKRFGNRYTWLPELGNVNHHEHGNIRIADPEKGIAKLEEILKEHPAILLCGCPEYDGCHRKVVADLYYKEHSGQILPLTAETEEQISCTTCQIPIEQAEEFYFTEDGTGYCCHHGPQAHPQIGQRVETPEGLATVSNIQFVETLQRWRCAVLTDKIQPDDTHFQVFDLADVHVAPVLNQGTLLQ
jgi:hypothetical protein